MPGQDSIRINFISAAYTPLPHGGLRVVFEYADFLAGRGHSVTLTFPRHLSPPRTPLHAVRRALWGFETRLRNRPLFPWHRFHPQVRFALVADLSNESVGDADIVVATMWPTATPVLKLSASKGKKYYLIQGYETWAGPEDEVNATWLLPLRKIVIARWLEEIGHRLGAKEMRYIPNGIDLEHFRIINPPQLRPPHVLSLYHKSAIKGVSDALAVLEAFHQRFPEIPASMFGAAERGAEIPGWIGYWRNPPQDVLVRDFYNRGTIYLGASLNEGWGLPPAEAMACGCVFIGTDIGGFRDFATHNETALLSPPRDREGMLRNLISVTEDRGLWQRLQQSGTQHIQRFTWERAGTELERYFRE
jgi:glycosyltransferase involved in cell wall biosynthesis